MDSWFPPPLTAFEMEARRVAAEDGRFPLSDPAMWPIQYPQNLDHNLPRMLLRSCSHSSSGSPPPYTEDQQSIIPIPDHTDSEALNCSHPNCSDQFIPMPAYHKGYLNNQPEWKDEHRVDTLTSSSNYSVMGTSSNHQDLHLKKRSSNVPQVRSIVTDGLKQGYSSSSSPLSSYDQVSAGAVNHRPNENPGNYAFINQVFKPLYKSEKHGELGSQYSYPLVGNGEFSQTDTLKPSQKLSPWQESSLSYPPVVGAVARKAKKSNLKRFPCPDCGRMFARAFNMETHRKTHIGYRPHHCHRCSKSFSRCHDLHRHLSTVHNEQTKQPQPKIRATFDSRREL